MDAPAADAPAAVGSGAGVVAAPQAEMSRAAAIAATHHAGAAIRAMVTPFRHPAGS
ncbi:MAG: hypothetical protein WCB51_01440 [Candidatus Dormiibacterota bacterium]